MNYLLIKKGFVVKNSTVVAEDILVGGNKVLEMGNNLEKPSSDTPVIDARGKYILPGAIDINRHFLDLVQDSPTQDELKKLNQAQIFNGTTTMIDTIEDCYEKNSIYNIYKAKEKSKSNLIDYSFHLTFSDLIKFSSKDFDYSYIHEGVSTFLINVSQLSDSSQNVIEEVFKNSSNHKLLVICDLHLSEQSESDTSNISLNNPLMLKTHFKMLSGLIDMGLKYGCPLLFLNVKFQEELELIQDGLEKGGDFYSSLRIWFNLGNYNQVRYNDQRIIEGVASENCLNPIGENEIWYLVKSHRYLINPPLYNLSYSEIPQEELVYNRPDAYFYIRNYMSMLYTVGVMQKKITISQLVDIVSGRPSKLMGLWPQKGVLQAGADADLVIWNPTFDRNLYCTMSNSNTTAGKNHKLKGRADFVFAKGRMVYNGESFYPKQSDGNFLFRTSKSY